MIQEVALSSKDKAILQELVIRPDQLADDKFDYSKVVVQKPWGYEYLIFTNEEVAVWILYLRFDAETSMHCHPNKKTSLIVLEGEVTSSTLEQDYHRKAGEGLLIPKAAFHRTRAKSPNGAFIMEIETPVNKRDLVRIEDSYGRQGQGYEDSSHYSRNLQNYNYLSLDGPEVFYNMRKSFGNCSLTFHRLQGGENLSDKESLKSTDVVSILKGTLKADGNTEIYELGDTVPADALSGALSACSYAEVLVIRKADQTIKASDCVASLLKERGIRELFVVPGDANVHLLDSIGRAEGLEFVAFPCERGAALATEAFAKRSGELGVLIISSGGSGPNALSGVSNAWIDSTPLLIISGQARTDQDVASEVRQLGNKALNVIEVVKPITKYAVKVTDPYTIRHHIEQAIDLATSGRPGPVWIDLPIDVQGALLNEQQQSIEIKATQKSSSSNSHSSSCKEVVELLSSCSRPVLLLGDGIRIAHAEEELQTLLDRLKIPTVTTRRGADLIDNNHPTFFGRIGSFGQRRANFIVQNCDLLFSIGSRLSIPLIGRNTTAFARAAKKIVVDIDPGELKKETINIDLPIEADAKKFIQEFLRELDKQSKGVIPNANEEWWTRCQGWKDRFDPLNEGYSHSQFVNPYLFLNELSKVIDSNCTVVIDGGAINHRFNQVFESKSGQRFVSSTGLELPGFGVAGSIGAAIASDGPVVCLSEDCGFQNGIPELQTIFDHQLPIKIFVLKTKGHSAIRTIQKSFFGSRFVGTDNQVLFGSPNFKDVASAYSIQTSTICSPNNLSEQLTQFLNQPGPGLCEVEVESEQDLAPRTGFTVTDDGKWLPRPIEDMYPFLDRQQLKAEMMIDLVEDV